MTEPKGHSWDAGIVTKEPTTTETGIRKFTCTTCLETSTEEIDKLASDPERLREYSENAKKMAINDAAKRIYSVIVEVLAKKDIEFFDLFKIDK